MRSFYGLVLALAAVGCSSSNSNPPPANDGGNDTGAAATFTQVYTTVIATNCMPCHTTATGEGVVNGKLDMTSQSAAYMNLVGVMAAGEACNAMGVRVVAGSPSTSILFEKVNPSSTSRCGAQMPLNGGDLAANDVALIQSWIQAGALNN